MKYYTSWLKSYKGSPVESSLYIEAEVLQLSSLKGEISLAGIYRTYYMN